MQIGLFNLHLGIDIRRKGSCRSAFLLRNFILGLSSVEVFRRILHLRHLASRFLGDMRTRCTVSSSNYTWSYLSCSLLYWFWSFSCQLPLLWSCTIAGGLGCWSRLAWRCRIHWDWPWWLHRGWLIKSHHQRWQFSLVWWWGSCLWKDGYVWVWSARRIFWNMRLDVENWCWWWPNIYSCSLFAFLGAIWRNWHSGVLYSKSNTEVNNSFVVFIAEGGELLY